MKRFSWLVFLINLTWFVGLTSFARETEAIPQRDAHASTALDYHSMPIDLNAPLSKEPLVKAHDYGIAGESYYYRDDGKNAPYFKRIPGSLPDVWLRRSVAELLRQVNRDLAKRDLEVYVLDGYRGIETQRALWDFFIDQGRSQLHTNDAQKLHKFAGQFCSDPTKYSESDEHTWPTHTTGGAVDLTLRSKSTHKLVDMGSGFDNALPISFTDALENHGANQQARDNRRLLYWAMTKAGFANYPLEWWHYDWGTQMWLMNSGGVRAGKRAWYGLTDVQSSN